MQRGVHPAGGVFGDPREIAFGRSGEVGPQLMHYVSRYTVSAKPTQRLIDVASRFSGSRETAHMFEGDGLSTDLGRARGAVG